MSNNNKTLKLVTWFMFHLTLRSLGFLRRTRTLLKCIAYTSSQRLVKRSVMHGIFWILGVILFICHSAQSGFSSTTALICIGLLACGSHWSVPNLLTSFPWRHSILRYLQHSPFNSIDSYFDFMAWFKLKYWASLVIDSLRGKTPFRHH